MKYWKVLCCAGFLVALASNVGSISGWSEIRGVYDDLCYLRQAHLFQRFGLGGLDTDISRDDDHYFSEKLKEIDFPTWRDPATFPCHTPMPSTKKLVMQYPPGTGFVLALFPSGFQVVPLYVLTSVVAFGFALAAVCYASSLFSLALLAVVGDAAIYLMINPTKASYSMAPTMMVCALAGFLTAKLLVGEAQRHRLWLTMLIGLLIGNLRLANLFLASGYFLFFLGAFLLARNRETLLPGAVVRRGVHGRYRSNAVRQRNQCGKPVFDHLWKRRCDAAGTEPECALGYFGDVQFLLLIIAGIWTALIWRLGRSASNRQVALIVAGNLVVNLIFFMTHPVFTPYYTIPVAMLSLWTLLFATLIPHREAIGDSVAFRQPVKA